MSDPKKARAERPRRPTFAIILLVAFILLVFVFIGFRQVRSAEERRLRLLAGFANRIESTVPDLADRFRRIAARRCADQVADYLDLVPHVEHLTVQPSGVECQDGEAELTGRETVEVHTGDGAVTIRFCRTGDCTFDGGKAELGSASRTVAGAEARMHLADVLEPMIIPGIFDSVVIADWSGRVLHQQGEPELKVTHLDALLGGPAAGSGGEREGGEPSWLVRVAEQGGKPGQLVLRVLEGSGVLSEAPEGPAGGPGSATAIVHTKIADADHSVFLQPVTLAVEPEAGQPTTEPGRWVAVGIISSERLLSAGVTTSPILLFLLVSILPLGLITWPFLKLALISRRQPFTRLDCAFLVLASVLALSFGALLLVDGLFVTRIQKSIDRQLAELSEVISRSFRGELLDARRQLGELNDPVTVSGGAVGIETDGNRHRIPNYFEFKDGREDEGEEPPFVESFIRNPVADFFTELGPPGTYPYFDSVFWPDSDGNVEGATLPLREHAVLPQNVADRGYVRCATEWEDPLSLAVGGERLRLCLDSVLDRTTGEAIAALSIPGPDDDQRPVAALVTQLTSLDQPVLPPEVSFAVVEPSGHVLFHSDPRRALTENLLEASDENRLLRALLEDRREGDLNLHYWGRRHRAYVRQIPSLPWSLVVFRSMEDVRLRNFELVYDFLNPFVLHLGVLALLAAAFKWMTPRRFRVYLWPSTRNLTAYRRIVWWTLGVAVLFVCLLLDGDLAPRWLFLASMAVAPATFLYVVWILPKLDEAERVLQARRDGGEAAPRRSWLLPAAWALDRAGPLLAWCAGRVSGGVSWLGGVCTRTWRRLRHRGPAADPDGDPRDEGTGRNGRTASDLTSWRQRRKRWLWWLAIVGVPGLLVFLWGEADAMAVWLAGVAGVTAVCLWWFRLEFEERRRKVAYTFALSCLLLVSVLPALGFLDLARARQVQLRTQDSTVALARRLEERRQDLEERRGPLPYYEDYERTLACARDEYLDAVSDTRILAAAAGLPTCPASAAPPTGGSTEEGEEGPWLWPYGSDRSGERAGDRGSFGARLGWWLDRGWVGVLSARPASLNDLSTRPVGVDLSRFRSTAGSWERRSDGAGGDRVVLETPAYGDDAGSLRLASAVPIVDAFTGQSFLRFMLFGLGLLVLGFGPFLLAWFVADKILLINLVYYGEKRRKDDEPEEGSEVEGTGRVSSARPGESLQDVLDEAKERQNVVRRLVVVAGELDRESWRKKVETTGDGGAEEPGDSEVADFHEAQFREAWELASGVSAELRPAERGEVHAPDGSSDGGESSEAGKVESAAHPASAAGRPAAAESSGPDDTGAAETARPVLPSEPGLSRRQAFEAALTRGSARRNQPILLTHFDPEIEDLQAAADQTAALQNLAERDGRSLVIVTDSVPMFGDDASIPPEAEAARMRWVELLGSFPVRYARDPNHLDTFSSRLDRVETWIDRGAVDTRERKVRAEHWKDILRTLERECEHTPTLRILGHQLLTELFVDVKREMVKDRVANLQKEEEEIPQRLKGITAEWNEVKVALGELKAELREVRSALAETAPDDPQHEERAKRRTDLLKRQRDLRERRNELKKERSSLRERRKEIPEEQTKERKRLTRVEKRARRYSPDYSNLVTEDHVIARIGAGARLHYRYLWSQCNRDEKLVLVQLAQHGLVNPKSFGWVLDLMHKGLVVRDPDLRLMNRSLRNFVLQEFKRSQALEWEEELGPNAWSVLKWILPFPLLGLAGFLFITQRDAVSNAAGVLVALASLTPVLFNLYEKFQEVNLRRERAAEAASGDG
ncbi:MAG: hypothetical protein PVG07_03130 [Acidobacteriota bacterium]|jgi:hypothetical protein